MKIIIEGIEEYFYEKLNKSERHEIEKIEGVKVIYRGHTVDLEISDIKLTSLVLVLKIWFHLKYTNKKKR